MLEKMLPFLSRPFRSAARPASEAPRGLQQAYPELGAKRHRFGSAGMSLIEIIIVIALMGTLMTIVITSLTGRQDEAMKDATRLAMAQLQTQLQLYRVHNYKYPTTEEGLDALITAPAGNTKWRGPYTEKNKLSDPWGNKFEFESNGSEFKIISVGKDATAGTEDDLYYPEQEKAEGGGSGQQ